MALGLRDKAYDLCRQYLSGSWKTINKDDMVFKAVSGGLTNVLFLCSLPSTHTPLCGEPSQVLMRMYGQIHSTNEHDSSVTKITESVIFMMLSERNLGPKLYGIFPEGRLEEYISARALTCDELRDPIISAIIARKLANVHSLNVPINKEPTWLFNTMYEWLEKVRTLDVEQMNNEDKQMKKKNKKQQQKQLVPFNYEAAKFIINFDYEHEIEWLKEFLKQCDSPVCFAHNDLQEGNILIPDYLSASKWSSTTKTESFLCDELNNNNHLNIKNKNKSTHHLNTNHLRHKQDFMNTFKFNHRRSSSPDTLYDSGLMNDQLNSDEDDGLVNDFNSEEECSNSNDEDIKLKTKQHYLKQLEEKMVLIDFEFCSYNWRGFDLANHFCEWMYDYSYDKFPHYKYNPQNYPNENQMRHFITEYVKHYHQGENYIGPEEEKATVEKILNEIRYFTLASHLLWTLWSVIHGINAQISFGYWEYGKLRLDSYLVQKKKLLDFFQK